MTRKEINLLNMLKSVVQFYTENPQLLIGKPALEAAVNQLKSLIAEVEALEQAQAKTSKTETALKGETKTALINAALKVLAGLSAHAAATNNTALKMNADFTERDLDKMRDNDLITKSQSFYELALPFAPELGTWHVTQADIDALDTNSAAFKAKNPAIKSIKDHSAEATAAIKAKLDEAYDFTKDSLDAMMLPYKMTEPTAYGLYQKSREIVHIAATHSKAKPSEDSKTVK
jgi:hypothetical protein